MLIENIVYRASVKATTCRDICVMSSDGLLDLKMSRPHELGGTNGRGTNPEQLFAASYAAGFLGIMRHVAGREGIALPTDIEVEANVAWDRHPGDSGLRSNSGFPFQGFPVLTPIRSSGSRRHWPGNACGADLARRQS